MKNRYYKGTKLGDFMYKLCFKAGLFIYKHKWLYYLLAYTWGLLLTIVGYVVSLVLLICGNKPVRYREIYYFSIGPSWGGLELGMCFLIDCAEYEHTKQHEYGHSFQNCILGPFNILLVTIPSAIRWWYRKLTPNKCHKPYDAIWFEECATNLGEYIAENY